jgi:predicted nucleotidyltransferase
MTQGIVQASTRNDRTAQPTDDPILQRFKAALDEIYGDRIDRVALFGSRARGDARDDSDYDVAVFLKTLPDHRNEVRRLADLRVDFLDDTGAFFDAKPYPMSSWLDRTPMMHEIRRDGLDLCSLKPPGLSSRRISSSGGPISCCVSG